MKLIWNLISASIVLCVIRTEKTKTEEISIGVLFDFETGEDIRTAIVNEISDLNSKNEDARLNVSFRRADMEDSIDTVFGLCELMASGSFAIIADHTMATINILKSYSATFRIPLITTGVAVNTTGQDLVNTTGQDLGYEVYMRPFYARAVVDVVKHFEWSDALYLYDSDEGLARAQQFMDVLLEDNDKMKIRWYRVQHVDEAFRVIHSFKSRNSERILLDLSIKDCKELFQKLEKSSTVLRHQYVIVQLGMDEIGFIPSGFNHDLNVIGFRMAIPDKSSAPSSLDELMYPNTRDFERKPIEKALAMDAISVISLALRRIMRENATSLKETSKSSNVTGGIDCEAEPVQTLARGRDIMMAMKEVEFDGFTGSVKFDNFGLRLDYHLDVLQFHQHQAVERIGSWHPENHLQLRKVNISPQKNNISRTLIITSILGEPYLMKKVQPEYGPPLTGNDLYEGYCADLAKMIAKFLQVDYAIVPVKDAKYGQMNEKTSSWNGMIGEIIRHEADAAIAPLTITHQRSKFVDFSHPFHTFGISIMMKKPKAEAISTSSFARPFTIEVWVSLIFAYICSNIVFYLADYLGQWKRSGVEEKTGKKEEKEKDSVVKKFVPLYNVWFCLGREPKSISGRVAKAAWKIFLLIIVCHYTAMMMRILVINRNRNQQQINSVEDLAKQNEIKYGTIHSGSTFEFFRWSTIPLYERMWAFMQSAEPSVFVNTIEEGVERVRESGDYAFLLESSTNEYINSRSPCDTMKVGTNIDNKGFGIATRLGSPLSGPINLAVMELAETQQLQKLQRLWWNEKGNVCPSWTNFYPRVSVIGSLRFMNIAGSFYVLIGGTSLALIVAGCHLIYRYLLESKRKKDGPTSLEEVPVAGPSGPVAEPSNPDAGPSNQQENVDPSATEGITQL